MYELLFRFLKLLTVIYTYTYFQAWKKRKETEERKEEERKKRRKKVIMKQLISWLLNLNERIYLTVPTVYSSCTVPGFNEKLRGNEKRLAGKYTIKYTTCSGRSTNTEPGYYNTYIVSYHGQLYRIHGWQVTTIYNVSSFLLPLLVFCIYGKKKNWGGTKTERVNGLL